MTLSCFDIDEFFNENLIEQAGNTTGTLQNYNNEIELELEFLIGGRSFFKSLWSIGKKIFRP